MKRVEVMINGITPLMCNRFTEEAQQKATNRTTTSLAGNKGTPKEQAAQRLYVSADGTPMIPNMNLFSCIIDGGKFFKMGKSKITTLKSSIIPACVSIDELEIPIISKDGWEVDQRPVRNPSTGGRYLTYRPRFENWRLGFTLEIDTEDITIDLVREIVDAAGKKIGLGDFRPSCKGPFGKFVVNHWKILPNK
ncbi:MAG: hypothetical protein V3V74_07255 [Nitrosomonadaceae bacterium]